MTEREMIEDALGRHGIAAWPPQLVDELCLRLREAEQDGYADGLLAHERDGCGDPQPKCSLCKHYKPRELEGHGPHGECNSRKFVRGYGHIGFAPLTSEPWDYGTEVTADGVHVENDEGWAFHVGPDFGCIHFDPR